MKNKIFNINPFLLKKEVYFKMSCSSGNGGQNVNRLATKATLCFPFKKSIFLDDAQKQTLAKKLKNRINKKDTLIIINQNSRSAEKNKQTALLLLVNLLQKALEPKKIRKKVAIPQAIHEKRRLAKSRKSVIKQLRKKPIFP